MKIPLINFEKKIKDSGLLSRWRDYFKEWYVKILREIGKNTFKANVFWTEDYEVILKLDDNNNISRCGCDCPYDWGPICKHQIAVFYNLREKFLNEWLMIQNEPKKQKLKDSPKENLKQYFKWIIKDSIRSASYRWYVERNMAWYALEWAETVVWEFEDFLEDKNYNDAVLALSVVIETLIIWLQDVDDSAWEYWGFIWECIEECLPKLIFHIKDYWNQEDKDLLVKEFLRLAWNKKIGWFGFEREILEKLVSFIDKNNFIKFKKVLDKLKPRSIYDDYSIVEFHMISAIWSNDEIEKFINKNLDKYDFAMFFVDILLKGKEYQRAESILLNQIKNCYRIKKIEVLEKLLEISKLTEDKEKEEKYLFELFLEDPYKNRFNDYKNFLWRDRYEKMKEDIFFKIDKSEMASNFMDYPNICLQEKDEKRFLDYIFRNPYISVVDRFFTKLLRLIPEELYDIYKREVEDNLVRTSNRKVYTEQCRKIRKMKKVFPEKTSDFIDFLKDKYKTRRALCEELDLV